MLKSKNTSQSGSIHVIVITVVIICVIGALGYVFWKNYAAKNDVPKKEQASTKPAPVKKSEIKVLAGDMDKYVNYEQGFEFLFPKAISADTECATSDYVYDTYGNKVTSKMHYITKAGSAAMTVLESGSRFVVTTKKYVVLSDQTYDGNHTFAGSCDIEPATIEKADFKNEMTDNQYVANMATRAFIVEKAANDGDITSFIQKNIYDKGSIAKVGKLADGRQDVTVDFGPVRTGGFAYKLWYYPGNHQLVYINLGQSVLFTSVNELGKYYDTQMVDSFKFSTE